MDKADLVTLAPVLTVGATVVAVVSSAVTTWLTGRRQRSEKREERETLRADGHRNDLRHAYAEFIGAYSELLAIARSYNGLFSATEEDGSPADPPPAESKEKLGLFEKATIDADILLAEVLLLEDDPIATDRLLKFWALPLGGPILNYEELQAHRQRFDELVRALPGEFSPSRWAERTKRGELTAVSRTKTPRTLPAAAAYRTLPAGKTSDDR